MGVQKSKKCACAIYEWAPSMSLNDDASQLKWSDIRQHWFYDDLSLGGYRSPSVIPVTTNIFTTDTYAFFKLFT